MKFQFLYKLRVVHMGQFFNRKEMKKLLRTQQIIVTHGIPHAHPNAKRNPTRSHKSPERTDKNKHHKSTWKRNQGSHLVSPKPETGRFHMRNSRIRTSARQKYTLLCGIFAKQTYSVLPLTSAWCGSPK